MTEKMRNLRQLVRGEFDQFFDIAMQLALPFFQDNVGRALALGQQRLERFEIDSLILAQIVDNVLPA
jgi:hypothetical protein